MTVLQTFKATHETTMSHGTKTLQLPELTANIRREGGCLVDNLFADVWKRMGMKARLSRLGFHKGSGTQAAELVYCLMIWVWLKVDAIGMFARESLQTFSRAERGTLSEQHWGRPRFP